MADRSTNIFRSVDWWTILIYFIMVVAGWLSINAACYNFDDASIFDFDRACGKQLVWMGLAVIIIFFIMSLDTRVLMTYPPLLYTCMIALLIVTIFIAPDIKGSRSWLKIGTLSIQPAEFSKFVTALMLGWLFNGYNFKFTQPWNFIKACLIVLLPTALIVAQSETGSALVYFSLVFLFYRQGMSGIVLFGGFSGILIFVLAAKYGVDPATGQAILKGQNLVLSIIAYMVSGMLLFWCKNRQAFMVTLVTNTLVLGVASICKLFIPLPFYWEYRWVAMGVCVFDILVALWYYLAYKYGRFLLTAFFSLVFVGFLYSVDYVYNEKLEGYQRKRIEVLLGTREDLKGDGYNVNQAKIAIGSGGFLGKGYLEGTQTKLSYVPEQETDFIFCTVGEEQGFVGSFIVLALFGTLILRLIYLAERQRTIFAQVYGYCVACYFFFHLIINIGMVIGLCPVIGIPLPYFSYGGSGLWSFTILLFIFLRLDASRLEKY